MAYEHKITLRIGFAETDMAGIVHFSNFFRYMEAVEHSFFRSLGFSVVTRIGDEQFGWPRVHVACDYYRPLHFEDEVEAHLLVRAVTDKAIEYVIRFRNLTREPQSLAAKGLMRVVCVERDRQTGRMRAVAIPPAILSGIQAAPAELL